MKTKHVPLDLPVTAVDVLVRQGGYQDLVKKHFLINRFFPHWPLNPTQLHANKAFVNALLQRRIDKVNQLADAILGATSENIASILDIGCGLGLVDLVLYKRISPSPDVYLLDKNNEHKSLSPVSGGFNQRFIFTADLDLARDIFETNGVKTEQLHFVEPDNNAIASLPKVDLILSITAWGFHFPIEMYWEGVQRILHNKSVIFIDLRKKTNSYSFLKDRFGHSSIVDETETCIQAVFSS
jgi:SAM-dependent methyltransferase